MALAGITFDRCSRIVSIASGPAKTLNAPTATSIAEGIARKV